MVPFLTDSLEGILRSSCAKFIHKDVLNNAKTSLKLLKIDVNDRANHKSVDAIDLGFLIKYKVIKLKELVK